MRFLRHTLLLAVLAGGSGCRSSEAMTVDPPPPSFALPALPAPALWPDDRALLSPPSDAHRPPARRWRVYIDAGHGAKNNSGVPSCFCEKESDFTLRVARHLAARLRDSGAFDVRLSRQSDGELPSYQKRVREADAWPADVFLSLHMDARGDAVLWAPSPGTACWRNDARPGFSILFSDDAPASLMARRQALARAVAARMEETGFLAYDGADYPGLYDGDAMAPGVFVDRHVPGHRIYVLRIPKVPSVIIETHHGLDVREARRWREPGTLDAFGGAVITALNDFLNP